MNGATKRRGPGVSRVVFRLVKRGHVLDVGVKLNQVLRCSLPVLMKGRGT